MAASRPDHNPSCVTHFFIPRRGSGAERAARIELLHPPAVTHVQPLNSSLLYWHLTEEDEGLDQI